MRKTLEEGQTYLFKSFKVGKDGVPLSTFTRYVIKVREIKKGE